LEAKIVHLIGRPPRPLNRDDRKKTNNRKDTTV